MIYLVNTFKNRFILKILYDLNFLNKKEEEQKLMKNYLQNKKIVIYKTWFF